QLRRIVEIQLGRFEKLLQDRKLALEMTDAAKDLLAREGYDPVYGARPLKRAMQRLVLDPLAMQLLQGAFEPGDTVVADATGEALVFRRKGDAVPTQPVARA